MRKKKIYGVFSDEHENATSETVAASTSTLEREVTLMENTSASSGMESQLHMLNINDGKTSDTSSKESRAETPPLFWNLDDGSVTLLTKHAEGIQSDEKDVTDLLSEHTEHQGTKKCLSGRSEIVHNDDQDLADLQYEYQRDTLEDAIQNKKITFWKNVKGQLVINKKHEWYFQVQGQLNITGRKECIFAVRTGSDRPIKVEFIQRDQELWNDVMIPKLRLFYLESILPELLDPRYTRNMPFREICPQSTESKKRKINK